MENTASFIHPFMGLFIHLILPLAGLIAWLLLLRKMRREQVPHPPKGSLFALFFIYGGVLTIILTGLCRQASGMSTLGLLFLIFIAPVICALILRRHRKHSTISRYHRAVRRLASGYLWAEAALASIILTLFIANLLRLFLTGAPLTNN